MAFPGFRKEKRYPGIVGGIDEAGRGPLAGPVVAACVILNRSKKPRGIHDSKQLDRARREVLFSGIMETSVVGVGICSVEEIDTHNILGATKLAMLRAYEAMPAKPDVALVDGNQLPRLPCVMDAIIDGDALCISIAAASIIAKVTRDRIMVALAEEFPQYGWPYQRGLWHARTL